MCNLNTIKRRALDKLDVWVKEAITNNRDMNLPIDVINITIPSDTYFSNEEFHEIERNINTIEASSEGLRNYCRDRDIDI